MHPSGSLRYIATMGNAVSSLIHRYWAERPHIRQLRDRLGLTQRQLADQLGVERATVARWECGARVPSRQIAVALENLADTVDGVGIAASYGLRSGLRQ